MLERLRQLVRLILASNQQSNPVKGYAVRFHRNDQRLKTEVVGEPGGQGLSAWPVIECRDLNGEARRLDGHLNGGTRRVVCRRGF